MKRDITESTVPKQLRPFQKGQSGNPNGRPKGSRNRATVAAETLLDGEVEKLTRKAVEMALSGDTTAMRLCLERILPPRKDRPILLAIPPLVTAADAVKTTAAIIEAVAAGDVTPGEAGELTKLVGEFTKALDLHEIQQRLGKLEAARESKL